MRRILIGTALLMLSGCGPGTPLTPSIADADAVKQIQAMLEARTFATPETAVLGGINYCTKDFEIQSVEITDKAVTGNVAKVSASIVLKNVTNETVKSNFENAGCFGVPPDGWTPGQLMRDDEVFSFSLWDSGWKIDAPTGR